MCTSFAGTLVSISILPPEKMPHRFIVLLNCNDVHYRSIFIFASYLMFNYKFVFGTETFSVSLTEVEHFICDWLG